MLILTLTKEYSQDEVSNANGEELGWLRKFQLTPQFRTAMTDLKVGATTKPIKLPYDLQVIRLLEHKSAGMVSMYEVRATKSIKLI